MSLFSKFVQKLLRLPLAQTIRQGASPQIRATARNLAPEIADMVIVGDGVSGRQAQLAALALAEATGTDVQVVAKKPSWLRLVQGLKTSDATAHASPLKHMNPAALLQETSASWEARAKLLQTNQKLLTHEAEAISLTPADDYYTLELIDALGQTSELKARRVLIANGTHSLLSKPLLRELLTIKTAQPSLVLDSIDYLTTSDQVVKSGAPIIVHGHDEITLTAVRLLLEQGQSVIWLADAPLDSAVLNYQLSADLQKNLVVKIGSIERIQDAGAQRVHLRCKTADDEHFDLTGQQLIVDLNEEKTAVDLLSERLGQVKPMFSPSGALARNRTYIGFTEQTASGARAYYVAGAADDIARASHKESGEPYKIIGYNPDDASPACRMPRTSSENALNELFSVRTLEVNWDSARLSDIQAYLQRHSQYLDWSESNCTAFSERLLDMRAKRVLSKSNVMKLFVEHAEENQLRPIPAALLDHLSMGHRMSEFRRPTYKA